MAMLMLLRRLGIASATTVHGLCRSTFSTWANETAAARPDVIEACLADHALAALAQMGLDPESADAQRCWRWIAGQARFTRGALTLAMRHVMDAKRISAALKVLAGRNLIDCEHGAPSPGTRERVFRVNPRMEVADGVA